MTSMITAVIPVREGSRRILNKNIRPFAGSSLLELKIQQLKRIDDISTILVSTDSERMLTVAKENGVVAKRRPKEYCDESSKSFNEVVEYIAEKEVDTEVMMWVPCVCPLVSDYSIKEGIRVFNEIEQGLRNEDSVASAKLIKEYIFDESGPINFSINDHVPSQLLPNWHVIVNGFFIAKRADMIKWKFVYGRKPYLFEISKTEGVDIDDEVDFYIAEELFNHRKQWEN